MFKDWLANLRQGWRKAFSLQSPYGPLDGEDHALWSAWPRRWPSAAWRRRRCCISRASSRWDRSPARRWWCWAPQPIIEWLFRVVGVKLDREDYERLTRILDRREGISAMIEQIERLQDSFKDPLK